MAIDPRRMKTDQVIRNVSGSFKTGGLLGRIGRMDQKVVPQFSSGSISLDLALGGGWPFGRMILIAGEFSTGKTLLALKASGEVKKIDSKTKTRIINPGEGSPGVTLFVDFEGSFDEEWAICHGIDPEIDLLCRPEYAQQGADVVQAAIEENIVDLIIVDSIAAMTPREEMEASTEDWQVGLQARVVGKALRKWQGALQKVHQDTGKPGPAIILLNQFRMKVGKEAMFGDPRVLPGGKHQGFASSITIYTKSQKYEDEEKETAVVRLSGTTKKNKLYVPHKSYEFEMALRDTAVLKKGEIDNAKPLVDAAKKFNLIKKQGTTYSFGKNEFSSQKEIIAKVAVSEKLRDLMWRSVLKAARA